MQFLGRESNRILLSLCVVFSSPESEGEVTKHHFCWHRQHGLSETICSVSFMMVTSVLIKELLPLILQCGASRFPPFL